MYNAVIENTVQNDIEWYDWMNVDLYARHLL